MFAIPIRARSAAALGAAVCLSLSVLAAPVRADEIVVRNLDTGAQSSINAWGITSEGWAEVKYKERQRSAEKTVPTITVVTIRRSDKSANAMNLRAAIAELQRGNHREAADALQAINGGGWKPDLETGVRKYVSFSENDPKGKNKRPPWISEYSHFYYTKALYLRAMAEKDRDTLEEALLALDDIEVPGGEEKATSGGFLGRFAGGNSRFFPEALAMKADLLTLLARYDEAGAAYKELYAKAIEVPLRPRWAYEGEIGKVWLDEVRFYKAGQEALARK